MFRDFIPAVMDALFGIFVLLTALLLFCGMVGMFGFTIYWLLR